MKNAGNDDDLRIEGIELRRGHCARTKLYVAELPDGARVEVPVMVVRGSKPGPVFYLGAAFHGDEVAGVEIVGRVATQLDPAALRGSLIVVPVQNPLAFQVKHRFFVGHMLKSPMDQLPLDPWASFPGDPSGNLPALVAHTIYDGLMRHADYMVDIHTPTTGGRYAPFAFLPPTRCGNVVDKAEKLARAFGADYILANDKGMYVGDKNPHTILGEKGIPAFGVEVGEGGRVDEEDVIHGVRGIFNVLKAVGMLAGAAEEFGKQIVIRTMDIIRVQRGGMAHLHVGLNDQVERGQVVATITNLFGEVVEEVRAGSSGPVVRIATVATVSSGERVAQLGVRR